MTIANPKRPGLACRLAIYRLTVIPLVWAALRISKALDPDPTQIALISAIQSPVGFEDRSLRAMIAVAKEWHDHVCQGRTRFASGADQ